MVHFSGVDDVEGLASAVVEVMKEAHENLAAAQVRSRQQGEGVYGLIWRSLCPELLARLREERLEAQAITAAGVPYKLVVIGDAVLFPWRPAGGSTPSSVAFGTSPARRRLWSQTHGQALLPLDGAELAVADVEDESTKASESVSADAVIEDVFDEAQLRHLRVVVVAMTSDARRLRRVEWGEASLDEEGKLDWTPETIYSAEDSLATPTSTTAQTFADGEPPTSGVTVKPNPQKAGGAQSPGPSTRTERAGGE